MSTTTAPRGAQAFPRAKALFVVRESDQWNREHFNAMREQTYMPHRDRPEVDYFPARGQSLEPARDVCRGCLVRDECAAYAIDTGQGHGVWGGLSERERRRLRRAGRAA